MNVSWLIPVRNGRKWLNEAVESALRECGSADEIVVVDDGSIDNPHEVIPSDPRIVLLRQDAKGIVAALEYGRAHCNNEIIARLDADDVALEGRIRCQRDYLAANPDVAVVGGRANMIAVDGCLTDGMSNYVKWVNGLTDLHAQLLVESPLFHPAVAMRASAIEDVGGYRDGEFPEDYELWLRLVASGYRLGAVSETVVRIRDHGDRLTRTHERYSRHAFERAKMEWLAHGPFAQPRRVAVWGAGRSGRLWLRWLLSHGHSVVAVIDPFQGTTRQGVPVVLPEAIADLELDQLVVAVGVSGAREQIRGLIRQYRPNWDEGSDWWAVC